MLQWWRARHSRKLVIRKVPGSIPAEKHVTSDSHGFEHIDPQSRVLKLLFLVIKATKINMKQASDDRTFAHAAGKL